MSNPLPIDAIEYSSLIHMNFIHIKKIVTIALTVQYLSYIQALLFSI